jgi:glycosyltransferase involved in cell wall biosynthesis
MQEHSEECIVSIIIPCYNAGAYLEETVQSALAQTFRQLEIVVVDDGSTDQTTLDLLRNHQWPRTRVLRQENRGPSAARNAGIKVARGEFILPLDADDKIDPTYVAKAVKIFSEQSEVGIVYCKAMRFGKDEGPWELPAYTLREIVIDNVIFCAALYRKADWQMVGGYNELLRKGMEDYDFWIKLIHIGREVHQLDEYLFFYRILESSRTTGFMCDTSVIANTYAEIYRSNSAFFSKHAHIMFEHRMDLYKELDHLRLRYRKIEALLARHPRLLRIAKWLNRRLKS